MTFKINKHSLQMTIEVTDKRDDKNYVYFEAKNHLHAIKQCDEIAVKIRNNKT